MDFVVYDLETTGLRPGQDEIIEIGAVRSEHGVVTATYHSLIRPLCNVPDEILQLTQIAQKDLATARSLSEVLPEFLAFISGGRLVAHNARFDFNFLKSACEQIGQPLPTSSDSLDTLVLARVLLPTERSHRLEDLANLLSLPLETAHRGLSDALTTQALLCSLHNLALELPLLTLQQLERLAGMFSPLTATWFGDLAEARMRKYGTVRPQGTSQVLDLVYSARTGGSQERSADVQTKPDGHARTEGDSEAEAEAGSWFTANSPLGQALPSFEVRIGQQQMVDAVTSALEHDTHLIAEAGTGTGKSLAYLIPAALYAAKTDSRVMVATHTIALQDQIERRDFPTLRSVMGVPLSLAVFKGRTHYLCMRKLAQENAGADFGTPQGELEAYMTLMRWVVDTPAGNREELAFTNRLSEVWHRVQSETETCIHKRCPFFQDCYYFRARGAAYEADIVVTNHALVLSDLKAEHRVLPRYEKVVFDEAHHLEEAATKHLGSEVSAPQIAVSLGRILRDGGKHGVIAELSNRLAEATDKNGRSETVLESLREAALDVRAAVDEAFSALGQLIGPGQSELRITSELTLSLAWKAYLGQSDRLQDLSAKLLHHADELEALAEQQSDSDLGGRMLDAAGFVRELTGRLGTLCQAGSAGPEWVVWVEKSGYADRPFISLHVAPIDVAGILRSTLFETKDTVILTSATLSVDGKFDYIRERLGLDDNCAHDVEEVSVPSPFDYSRQALLCVPTDIPELAGMQPEQAAIWVADSIFQLARASQGKLLALFTSHVMLRAVARALRDPLQSIGLRVFAQGVDGNRAHLLESFRQGTAGVLLGAQSFWEGIDLPGDQLTTLVIVRLPFAPPTHPVTAARHERLEQQGKSSFWHASLPEAVVRFRQGFGRLIRTTADRGVVVVYDKRIITARYGRAFVRSLTGVRPFVAPEQDVIDRVAVFLAPTDNLHNASTSAHTN
ncbi:helicase C-terminal domain-containing protein [Alicyclobacillus sp. ALC3]|uniref:helicase C-terminal domain-containing protein n=1 Tax=Alicyclobacillus sp. ALC3 TaxID=2796143 RepID=UPI002378369F|nr:helicase C-terminal domain-containing protein [Alicyclobacillus sp. ALC3]WDL97227.1 DEAD/DEAH box helicase family protein [Alicyclobacillus sp. ALC3]